MKVNLEERAEKYRFPVKLLNSDGTLKREIRCPINDEIVRDANLMGMGSYPVRTNWRVAKYFMVQVMCDDLENGRY